MKVPAGRLPGPLGHIDQPRITQGAGRVRGSAAFPVIGIFNFLFLGNWKTRQSRLNFRSLSPFKARISVAIFSWDR